MPLLLETNYTPSFRTDTPIDHQVKSSLIRDVIAMLNLSVKVPIGSFRISTK